MLDTATGGELTDDLAMMRHLLSYPPHILEALAMDTVPGVALHISPVDTIKEFVPRKCQRTMIGEDVLVPRICTDSTLLGCIRGYAVILRDFLKRKATNAGNDSYRGGYYIYRIPYNVSVLPDTRLCPMARWIDERWLLPYRSPEMGYPGEVVGKLFVNRIAGVKGMAASTYTIELLVEVMEGEIMWDAGRRLEVGYHRLTVPEASSYFDERFDIDAVSYDRVSISEYMQRKGLRAELLSYGGASVWGGMTTK